MLWLGEVEPRLDRLAVLVEDGRLCVFEDRVGKRIAEGDLLANFDVEVVGGVFGFPVAAMEIEVVAERAVGADLFAADAGGLLGNEVPTGFSAGGSEQVLEGGADGRFVGDFVVGVAGKLFVVAFDLFVGRLEMVGIRHGAAQRGENWNPFRWGDDSRCCVVRQTNRNVVQRQLDATDREIDQLVYQLYGLTDKEIALVEEATK